MIFLAIDDFSLIYWLDRLNPNWLLRNSHEQVPASPTAAESDAL